MYFLLTRDRGTIIRNSVFAAVIGAVWVLLGGIVYAASWSLLSWTLIIPGVISWAAVQYVYTVAKLGLRIHSNGNSNSSAVEILRVGRKCVIDKCRIDDVVVAEKTPDGREKRDAGDCKYFLALKLLDTDGDGDGDTDATIHTVFYDLKKSVLESARTAILAALGLDDKSSTNDDDGGEGDDDDNDNGVAEAEAEVTNGV